MAVLIGMTCKRYEAQGWPSGESITASMSSTVYATTNCKNHPNSPPVADVSTMARGDATLALLHSSLRWKGESYPDMVQITATKVMRTATPSGKSVMFSIVPHTLLLGVKRGLFLVPAGMQMSTVTSASMLNVDPHELNLATHEVGMQLIPAWMIIRRTVSRNTCQYVGSYAGL